MLVTNMASDNSLPDVKGNATPPYSDFNDYGDYKDFSNPQLKDHIDKGFSYSLSGDNKDFDIPLLGDESRNHMDRGFVNPLSSDSGFSIPLLGDQGDFINPSSDDDKNSFIARKPLTDRMGSIETHSSLGNESDSKKLSEDLPQFQSGEDKFSAEGFIYETGGGYQYNKRSSSSCIYGDRSQCDGSRPQGHRSGPQGDGSRSKGDVGRPQGHRGRPHGDGFFSDGYTRFPPVGGSKTVKDSHSGNAFPESLENILKKIDNITGPQTSMGGSKCVEDEKALHDRFRNENRKDNPLKSRRPTNRRRDFQSEEPYHRNSRGRDRQSGGTRVKDTRKSQGMSYLKCQITTADHKLCPAKGFRFWYEVLPHMYYNHMEHLYQLSVTTSTIALSCPYNDPSLGICCESQFATSQPYDSDQPFNEQLAQALFLLITHIEKLHNGRSSSGQCPVCKDALLVRPYVPREMAMFWIHLATHLPEFLALPPGAVPGKPIELSVRGDLRCVCDYHFGCGHDYVSHIVNHHSVDIEKAAARDGWVKLNCPAAVTCRFETRRVVDVEPEVELGLAYSQLYDHIREWHARGKIAPVHHCPKCLVSTTGMPDHVMWRHVARHEDLGAYFCVPCGVFVLRRAMGEHLRDCRAVEETRVGGKGDVKERKGDVRERKGDVRERKGNVRERKGDVRERKGDVKERLLQLSGSVQIPIRPKAGEMQPRMPRREMGNRHWPRAREMEHRMHPREDRLPIGEMDYGHRMPPPGELEYGHRLPPREMDYGLRMPAGELEYGHRLPAGEIEYTHGLPPGEMEYGQGLPPGEMKYIHKQIEQRRQHRLPAGEMKINTSNIWDERTPYPRRWEVADPEGHQNRPEENFSFNESVEESSMVKAQFELQYASSTSYKDFNNQRSVEKDFNQNVKLPFIEGPEIGWGDFSNLEKPESLERFQNIENKQSQIVENQLQLVESNFNDKVKSVKVANKKKPVMVGDKNLFNAFTEDEVTTSEKIIQVKSDDLHETYIIPKISKLEEQNDVNEASPVKVVEHKKIKVTLLNREKVNDLDKNPGGSDPTISSTFTLDTCGDTIPAISSNFRLDTSGDAIPAISSNLTQDTCDDAIKTMSSNFTQNSSGDAMPTISSTFTLDTCGDTIPAISSNFTQDSSGDNTPMISSGVTQDTCGDTKSAQETCKEGSEVLNKQSIKQFACDVCGTKFMKEHILNFHRAIHK